MAFVKNVDLKSVLSNPVAVSAILSSCLRKVLEAEWAGEFFPEVLSVSEKGGKVSIRTSGPLAASALRMRKGKIEAAFSATLAEFGFRGRISANFR